MVDALVEQVRAGELPVTEEPRLLTKPGENVHMVTVAVLKAEVTHTTYKGSEGGASVGVGPLRVGGGGGSGRRIRHTSTEVVDTGTLIVTSIRAVYLGNKHTVEFPYSKLVGFEVERPDTLFFHLPNRKMRPIGVRPHPGLRVSHFDLAVAVIRAALARTQQPSEPISAGGTGSGDPGTPRERGSRPRVEPPAVGTRGTYRGRPAEVVRIRERDNALRIRLDDGSERWIAPSSLVL